MIQSSHPYSLQNLDNPFLGNDTFQRNYFSQNNISSSNPSQPVSISNRLTCEFCFDSCCSEFYFDHMRICKQNPANLGPLLQFNLNRNRTSNNVVHVVEPPVQQNSTSDQSLGLKKTLCTFCRQPCYLLFHNDHKRVCSKNPENIKIGCRTCKKTVTAAGYQSHLAGCEGNGPDFDPYQQDSNQESSSLPVQSCRNVSQVKDENVNKIELVKECPICIEEIKGSYEIRTLPCCHYFHRHCIEKWSKKQKRCPLCRYHFAM